MTPLPLRTFPTWVYSRGQQDRHFVVKNENTHFFVSFFTLQNAFRSTWDRLVSRQETSAGNFTALSMVLPQMVPWYVVAVKSFARIMTSLSHY